MVRLVRKHQFTAIGACCKGLAIQRVINDVNDLSILGKKFSRVTTNMCAGYDFLMNVTLRFRRYLLNKYPF